MMHSQFNNEYCVSIDWSEHRTELFPLLGKDSAYNNLLDLSLRGEVINANQCLEEQAFDRCD